MNTPQEAKQDLVSKIVLLPGLGDGIAVPHHEIVVCCAVLDDTRVYTELAPILHPRDFSDMFHSYFWKASEIIVQAGGVIAHQQLADALHSMTSYADTMQYTRDQTIERIRHIFSNGEKVGNAFLSAQKVKESAIRLRAIKEVREMERQLRDTHQPLDRVLNDAELRWFKATEQRAILKADSASAAMELKQDILAVQAGKAPIIKTGFNQLDDDIGGFGVRKLHMIVGNSGEGKSQWVMSLIRQICTTNPSVGIVAFHFEMEKLEVFRNYIAMETGIYRQRMISGNLSADQTRSVDDAIQAVGNWNLWTFDDPSQNTVPYMQREIRSIQARNPEIKQWLVVADGLWLMENPELKNAHMSSDHYSGVMQEFKKMMYHLNCAVLLVHQFRGGGVSDTDIPKLAFIEGLGKAFKDAQFVFGLKRWRNDTKRPVELYRIKGRGANDQTVPYQFEYYPTHALYAEPLSNQQSDKNAEKDMSSVTF